LLSLYVARLRTEVMFEAIRAAMALATKWMNEPEPVRVVHASVQGNHLRRAARRCRGR
jgi:hypothetical protein